MISTPLAVPIGVRLAQVLLEELGGLRSGDGSAAVDEPVPGMVVTLKRIARGKERDEEIVCFFRVRGAVITASETDDKTEGRGKPISINC